MACSNICAICRASPACAYTSLFCSSSVIVASCPFGCAFAVVLNASSVATAATTIVAFILVPPAAICGVRARLKSAVALPDVVQEREQGRRPHDTQVGSLRHQFVNAVGADRPGGVERIVGISHGH